MHCREISSLRGIAVHGVKPALPFGLAQLQRAGSTTSAAQLHTKSRAPQLAAPLALVLSQGRSPVRTEHSLAAHSLGKSALGAERRRQKGSVLAAHLKSM